MKFDQNLKKKAIEKICRDLSGTEVKSSIVDRAVEAILSITEDNVLDSIFIKHIKAHLQPGQQVVCKICGKTAEEIFIAFEKEIRG